MHWGIILPLKALALSLFFCQAPYKSENFQSSLPLPILFSLFVPLYFVFLQRSLKSNFRVNPHNNQTFHP